MVATNPVVATGCLHSQRATLRFLPVKVIRVVFHTLKLGLVAMLQVRYGAPCECMCVHKRNSAASNHF